jgi:hypothetical protein
MTQSGKPQGVRIQMKKIIPSMTLVRVMELLKYGEITEGQALEYVRGWNGSRKHFSLAAVVNGRIRQFDPVTQEELKQLLPIAEKNGFGYISEYIKK